MHIGNEIISPVMSGVGFAVSGTAVIFSSHKLKSDLKPNVVPLLSVLSAFVFAAQMVNFPVGLSSGHLGGGVLLCVLLGPFACILGMTSILTIQCLVFQDGGLIALGLNIFNMGVVPALIYTAISKVFSGISPNENRRRLFTGVASAYIAIVVGAILVPFEISYSKAQIPFGLFLGWMITIHAIIGIGEAVITGGVIAILQKTRPETFTPNAERMSIVPVAVAIFIIALFIGAVISNFASSMPDGLEMSVEKSKPANVVSNESQTAPEVLLPSAVMPDYTVPSISNPYLSTGLAGFIGTLLTFTAAFLIIKIFARNRTGENGGIT